MCCLCDLFCVNLMSLCRLFFWVLFPGCGLEDPTACLGADDSALASRRPEQFSVNGRLNKRPSNFVALSDVLLFTYLTNGDSQ